MLERKCHNLETITGFAVSFSRLWVLGRRKLRLRFAKPSESRGSRSRFSWRNAPKEPTQNIAGKERVRRECVDSDYLEVRRDAFLTVGKPSRLAPRGAPQLER
jgi:hypothetical protein